MTTQIEALSFKPSSATGGVARRFDERTIELALSVKDFGAVGSGNVDDTTAIQNCLDAAFGTWASPHGLTNAHLNRPVFFPSGFYRCVPSFLPQAVSGSASNAGEVRLTVASTTGLAVGDVVYVRGVLGTTEANGSWTIRSIDASPPRVTLRNSAWVNAWISGGTIAGCALRVRSVYGGHIFGAGKGSTSIGLDTSLASSGITFEALGFKYCTVQDMTFSAVSGICFDLNDDGNQLIDTSNNLFLSCNTGGSGSDNSDHGWAVGMGKKSCHSNAWVGGYYATGKLSGISFNGPEAVNNKIEGGNMSIGGNSPTSPNTAGVLVNDGACNSIIGISFQHFALQDIWIKRGDNQAYAIHGCRSESTGGFIRTPTSPTNLSLHIAGCNMSSSVSEGAGPFFFGGGNVTFDACGAIGFYINGTNASVVVNSCDFGYPSFLSSGPSPNFKYVSVFPIPVRTVSSGNYTIVSSDGGSKLRFSAAGTITLNKSSNNTCNLNTGTQIIVQATVAGSNQVTFAGATGVTINCSTGLHLKQQWSVATLTCDGTDTWTLSGDTA